MNFPYSWDIFLPLRFYVKSILAIFRSSKTAILTILEALKILYSAISALANCKNFLKQKFRSAETITKVDLEIPSSQEMISRKI